MAGIAWQIAVFFPVKVRTGKHNPWPINRPGVFHFGDVNVLLHVDIPFPARPNHVQLAIVLKNIPIDGPFVGSIGYFSFKIPIALHRVRGSIFQDIHAVMVVVAVIRCKIHVPFALDKMDLRGPDFLGIHRAWWRSPNDFCLSCFEIGQVFGFPNAQSIAHGMGIIVVAVLVKAVRVGPRGQQGICEGLLGEASENQAKK